MRIIFDKTTKKIVGLINDRKTSHLPPSLLGMNTDFFDIDYSEKDLKKDKLAQIVKKEKNNLLGKKLIAKNGEISFKELPKRKIKTVYLDIKKPEFHKDINIYVKKAKEKGVKVQIRGSKQLFVDINVKEKTVGTMQFLKKGCCKYFYNKGIVKDRKYYPHYIGMYEVYKYLKEKKFKYIDLGGLTGDTGVDNFKKKWGKIVEIER
jgi:hypothetical protein